MTWLGTNFSIENVLGSIRGNYNAVYYFNTSYGNYTSYVPGRAVNDLVNVYAGAGNSSSLTYQINVTTADRIQIL